MRLQFHCPQCDKFGWQDFNYPPWLALQQIYDATVCPMCNQLLEKGRHLRVTGYESGGHSLDKQSPEYKKLQSLCT